MANMEKNNSWAAAPVLIWGAGAIGGTLGAFMARAGEPIILVDAEEAHVRAINAQGLHIEGPVETFHQQPLQAWTPAEVRGRYDRIILAVKAQHTEAALAQLLPHLSDDGCVLSAQNGLNELVIARMVGEAHTVGCFVNFGADYLEPGRILLGNRAKVAVGELDSSIRERTREMHRLLSLYEPEAELTDNIWGYLWGKMGYGSMLFATALTSASMSENFANEKYFPVFNTLGRETMATALSRQATPLGFNGFDPAAFYPGAEVTRARRSVAAMAEFNRHTAKTHSGIWRDLAVRKRKTEVDPLMGSIVRLAREAGVPTPALERLIVLIHDIEEGRRPQSWETLDALLEVCR